MSKVKIQIVPFKERRSPIKMFKNNSDHKWNKESDKFSTITYTVKFPIYEIELKKNLVSHTFNPRIK